ncbi:MAG: hypothetical protein AB1814_11110 [Thermodesulfobacteriota bacterium]
MWQTVAALALVGLAAFYVVWRIRRTLSARRGPSCGCSGGLQTDIGRAPDNKPGPPSCGCC